MPPALPRMYDDLAEWWPLLSPPGDYEEDDCEHLPGDMRSLRSGREFEVVLIHDAIMYATEPAAVRATTFAPTTDAGGHDSPDGRGLRYLEWSWDPDPGDDTYIVDYGILLQAVDGTATVAHDRHVEGIFSRAQWLQWFSEAGIPARSSLDPWGRDVFVGHRAEGHRRGLRSGGERAGSEPQRSKK